jgi:DNA repair photolyase
MNEDQSDKINDSLLPIKGRGALSNRDSRYSTTVSERESDGWWPEERPTIRTQVTLETSRRVICRNQSPDIPFEQSINAYRGCEHGCIYCYARPSHAYLGLSPGLDFESQLFVKPKADQLLRKELAQKHDQVAPLALGANTDPYQPIEREWQMTRKILEVLYECRHPVAITTKSALVERDLDLLQAMAKDQLVQIQISITTLVKGLALKLEPRASSPQRRLITIQRLSEAGIPVTILVAPVIPVLTDPELETILEQAATAGAIQAGYMMLRLPRELTELFHEWLETHVPLQAKHILARLNDIHGGRIYRSQFGLRQLGSGPYADMMGQRFRLALKRFNLNPPGLSQLNISLFRPPNSVPIQLSLF